MAHLEDLKIQDNIRAKRRVEKKNKRSQKSVHQYAWLELVETGNIKKLLVSELEKYLEHYKLSNSGAKADKIRRISLHVLGANEGKQNDEEHADDISLSEAADSTEGESDSEDDLVLAELIERCDNESGQETAVGNVFIDANDKLCSLFQSDSEEGEFYGFS